MTTCPFLLTGEGNTSKPPVFTTFWALILLVTDGHFLKPFIHS